MHAAARPVSDSSADPPSTGVLRRVVIGVVLAGALSVASWWPFWATNAATGVVNVAVAVSFVATAAVLYQDVEQRLTALAIGSAALFYLTSWWWGWPPEWQVGPLPLISFLFGYLWFVLGGLALMQYPNARLGRRSERLFFVVMAAWVVGLKVVLAVFSRPGWAGFAPGAWWPAVAPNRAVFDVGTLVFNAGLAVLTLGLLALLVTKIRGTDGLEFVDAAPAVVAAATVAVCGVVYLGARVIAVPDYVQDQLRIVVAIAALATPLSFLAAVLRRLHTRSRVAERVPGIARSPLGEIQDVLRATLHDPDLRLWFWRVTTYVGAGGTAEQPRAAGGRWLLEIPAGDGGKLALVETGRSLQRRPDIIASVTQAIVLALERQAQVEEIEASRARINDAELAARERTRRDVHDGVAQHLLAARYRLHVAGMRARDDDVAQVIDDARHQVDEAVEAFSRMVRGGFPPLLSSGGLRAALPGVITRLDVDAVYRCTEQRFPETIERHLYALISEALTNVRRYAPDARVQVTVTHADATITVVIVDDGPGGADASLGTGLSGMADRVHALHGRFAVRSTPGDGTRIDAEIPCE